MISKRQWCREAINFICLCSFNLRHNIFSVTDWISSSKTLVGENLISKWCGRMQSWPYLSYYSYPHIPCYLICTSAGHCWMGLARHFLSAADGPLPHGDPSRWDVRLSPTPQEEAVHLEQSSGGFGKVQWDGIGNLVCVNGFCDLHFQFRLFS
jgi:hypothetical protein